MTNTNETTKHQYFTNIAEKLSDPNISYWFILKCFLTGKKVLSIPPIFHEQRFIDYSEKAELFNSSFANQCSLERKRSVLISNFLQINPYLTLHLQWYWKDTKWFSSQQSSRSWQDEYLQVKLEKSQLIKNASNQ